MAYVVIHVAVSLDGATAGFEPDVARFYALAATWREDVTLAGADTILAQEAALAGSLPGPAPDGPLLAVVDSRERVPAWMWDALRRAGHWRDAVRVTRDLGGALAGFGDAVVRVDSGGALNGALLRAGLVHEISLLVHPCLVGSGPRWYGDPPPKPLALEPLGGDEAGPPGGPPVAGQPDDPPPGGRPGGGLAWLRYRVRRAAPPPPGRDV